VNDLQKSLYTINSARLAGNGKALGMSTFPLVCQGMFTFRLVGQGLFTVILVGPADASRLFTLVMSRFVYS